jgi:hypothetical protein
MSGPTGKTAMTRRIMMNTMVAGAAVVAVPTIAQAAPDTTAELLDLQAQISEAHEAATVHYAEITRLGVIVAAESKRLHDDWQSDLTKKERWALVVAMPEPKEHDRLVQIAEPYNDRVIKLIERMWSIPATTPEGRQAKFLVLLDHVMRDDWMDVDGDWDIEMARGLLIEFIGGEPAKQLRDQFARL